MIIKGHKQGKVLEIDMNYKDMLVKLDYRDEETGKSTIRLKFDEVCKIN